MIYHFIIFVIANSYFNYLIIEQNQNWHYLQITVLVLWILLPIFYVIKSYNAGKFLSLILCYPFLFNSFLNLFRRLPINHLGNYDFIPFWLTVLLCVLGLAIYIFIVVVNLDRKNISTIINE